MLYREVTVELSRMHSVTKYVISHEIPVLRSVMGDEAVHTTGRWCFRDTPKAVSFAHESARLEQIYGVDHEWGISHLKHTYGPEAIQLRAAIRQPLAAYVLQLALNKLHSFLPRPQAEIPDYLNEQSPPSHAPIPPLRDHSTFEGAMEAVNRSLEHTHG